MKKNSTAFVLIKNLTMSEKRYFKIFSEQHTIGERNKYLLLFDLLDGSEKEDDRAIKEELKKINIKGDYLSADKNYLASLILSSLENYHSSKTYNLKIKELLLSIEILFYKGLYEEALKLISKAEKLAEVCENFQLMIDVLAWKKKCSGYSHGLKEAYEANLRTDHYLDLLRNVKQLTDLYYESNLLQSLHEKQTRSEVLKKFRKILRQPEMRSEKMALSFSARIFYYLVCSNYYYYTDEKEKELDSLQKLVHMLNGSPGYAIENPLDYISIYNRLLSIKKHFSSSTFFEDIRRLNDFPKKVRIRREIIEQRVFVHTSTHELEYHLINNEFEKALRKTGENEKKISAMNLDIEPYHMMYFYYLHAVALLFTGQFHKAIRFINSILNDFGFDDRPQVYLRVEILNAIVHFELGNASLVLSSLKQVLKKNRTQSILTLVEEEIVNTLIRIAKTREVKAKEEHKLFRELILKIQKAKKNRKGYNTGLLDNYEKWVTARLNGKKVSELFAGDFA